MAAKEQRRITSTDVARESGVSRATVSYVLNNDPRQSIPLETRERVLKAADTLGYHPLAEARNLRAGYSRLVLAVLQFEQVDPNIAHTLKELETGLAAHGYSLIWHVGVQTIASQTHPSSNVSPAVIVSFGDETDPTFDAFLRQFNVPVLPLNNVASRNAVGRAQVGYLVQQGHRRIVFAAPERADLHKLAQARLEGVQQGCVEHGLAVPLVKVVPLSLEGAQAAVAQILVNQSPPFGVCCYNDETAFAVLAGLSAAGLPVPASVAVIGCDDIPLAQFAAPPLTTIGFDTQLQIDHVIADILAQGRGEARHEARPYSLSVIARGTA